MREHVQMKRIGFLSFGHWTQSPHSHVRTAAASLLQSIELAVAAEELGADGAHFRVHHFARQLGSPFPLLAAVGARTHRIERRGVARRRSAESSVRRLKPGLRCGKCCAHAGFHFTPHPSADDTAGESAQAIGPAAIDRDEPESRAASGIGE